MMHVYLLSGIAPVAKDKLIGGLTPLEWHDFTEENIDRYVVD